jgi:hypothetical protein
MSLRFENTLLVDTNFYLGQNKPNPLSDATIIPIELNSEQKIQLRVFDIQGKILMNTPFNLSAGKHEITIHQSDLNTTGIVFYSVQSDNQMEIRRMMVIE